MKLNKKGFTLIEIVIVIVIIAILAAMLVPALTKWIDKSKMKTFTTACGTIRTSIAATLSEKYATDSTVTLTSLDADAWQEISEEVGKNQTVSMSDGAKYKVSGTSIDDLKITDGKYTGEWLGEGQGWKVTKNK